MATRKYTGLPYTELEVADGNFDTNRLPIDLVVLHTTVGTRASAAQRFDTPGTQVSAHYIVDTDGAIYALLEEYNVGYHAGNYGVNQRSIGIEHCDNGDYNGIRPDSLYETSSKLVHDICKFYNIPIDRTHIIGHREVPYPTGCPDALDLDRIVNGAKELSQLPPTSQSPVQTLEDQIGQCRLDRDTNYNLLVSVLNATSVYVTDSLDKNTATKKAIDTIRGMQQSLDACNIENTKLRTAVNAGTSAPIAPPSVAPVITPLTQPKQYTLQELIDVIRHSFMKGGGQ